MSALPIRFFALALLLAGLTQVSAQAPPRPSESGGDKLVRRTEADDKKSDSPSTKSGESLRPPPDGILVIVEQAADALKMAPKFFMVPPEKWKEMNDELARLRTEGKARAVATASSIQITGKIDSGVAALTLTFNFTTEKPNSLLNLGCGPPAQATGVSLDGRVPWFNLTSDGYYSVMVEKPGDHEVKLELFAPARAGRLLLDVPRAPTTNIELTLPPGAKDLHAADRPIAEAFPFVKIEDNTLKGALGVLDKKLDLSWKAAGSPSTAGPVLIAVGKIRVRVEERRTLTEAELTLKPLGGPAREWRLLVPPNAEIRSDRLVEGRYSIQVDSRNRWLRTLRLAEPEEEPFVVTVTVAGDAPRQGKPVAVGPFLVVGALRQSGDLLVSSTVPGLRLDCQPRGELARRDLSEEERRQEVVDAFTYRVLTPSAKVPADPATLALLDLEAEVDKRSVETLSVAHAFKLLRDEQDDWQWQVTTTLKVQPLWAGADRLSLELPPGWELDERNAPLPGERVQRIEATQDKDKKIVLIRFSKARATADVLKPFQIQIKALGPHANDLKSAELPLPRLLDAVERGPATVSLTLPDELEVTPQAAASNPSLELVEQSAHRLLWKPGPSADRLPDKVRVAWRVFRPELLIRSEIDLTLGPLSGQVRQSFRCQLPRNFTTIELQVPEALKGRLEVVEGGRLEPTAENPRRRIINLTPTNGAEQSFVLKYSFPYPEAFGDRLQEMPLIHPAPPAKGELRVRIWDDGGPTPEPVAGLWTEQPREEIPTRRGLPTFVLTSTSLDAVLAMRLTEGHGTPATLLVSRGLIRTQVTDTGTSYRASYLLTRLAKRALDVEMPIAVKDAGLRVTLDGNPVTYSTLDEGGQVAETGRVARLRLSLDTSRKTSILDVSYQLPGPRVGSIQATFRQPILRGDIGRVPVRWMIQFPLSQLALAPESGEPHGWGPRGWLLAPRLTTKAIDLERWFVEPDGISDETDLDQSPSYAARGFSGDNLVVTIVPRQAWIVVCSLLVIGVGLSLFLYGHGQGGRVAFLTWAAISLVLILLTTALLLWPDVTALVIYGCEPGAVVLIFASVVQWLLHVRYRHQIVFLPSFSRSRGGSSLLRNNRPIVGEPSTVDGPRVT